MARIMALNKPLNTTTGLPTIAQTLPAADLMRSSPKPNVVLNHVIMAPRFSQLLNPSNGYSI